MVSPRAAAIAAAHCPHAGLPSLLDRHQQRRVLVSPTGMADDEEDPPRGDPDDPPGPPPAGEEDWLRLGIGLPRGEIRELRLFPHHPLRSLAEAGTSSGTPEPAGTSGGPARTHRARATGLRAIGAPARPQIGIWFALLAAPHQSIEPYLAQIPKRYLRIKDGSTPIRLLMRYLATKLGLDSEYEVEITCRGHQLVPSQTLQQVRDSIWWSREAMLLLPSDSPSRHAMMTLHYGRSPGTPTRFL